MIDIQDWVDEVLRREAIVHTRKEIEQLGVETSPRFAAIAAIVSRHLGEAPEEILKPNKTLLMQGAAGHIYVWIRYLRKTVELENGREVTIPMYNKPFAAREDYTDIDEEEVEGEDIAALESAVDDALDDIEEEIDRSYAEFGTDRYLENDVGYMHGPLMGHIRNRLNSIAFSAGLARARQEWEAFVEDGWAIIAALEAEVPEPA